jgi:hypothetical protein
MAKYAYHRIDGNAGEVITAMREEGASVEPLGRPVDVAVGIEDQTELAEIKTITGRPRPSQERFWLRWKGRKVVLRTKADGRALVQRLKRQAAALREMGVQP